MIEQLGQVIRALVGAWPVLAILAAAILRLLEQALIDDARSDRAEFNLAGKLLVELLTAASWACTMAAGVGFALLWGMR